MEGKSENIPVACSKGTAICEATSCAAKEVLGRRPCSTAWVHTLIMGTAHPGGSRNVVHWVAASSFRMLSSTSTLGHISYCPPQPVMACASTDSASTFKQRVGIQVAINLQGTRCGSNGASQRVLMSQGGIVDIHTPSDAPPLFHHALGIVDAL
jgi:hypothetical protein